MILHLYFLHNQLTMHPITRHGRQGRYTQGDMASSVLLQPQSRSRTTDCQDECVGNRRAAQLAVQGMTRCNPTPLHDLTCGAEHCHLWSM